VIIHRNFTQVAPSLHSALHIRPLVVHGTFPEVTKETWLNNVNKLLFFSSLFFHLKGKLASDSTWHLMDHISNNFKLSMSSLVAPIFPTLFLSLRQDPLDPSPSSILPNLTIQTTPCSQNNHPHLFDPDTNTSFQPDCISSLCCHKSYARSFDAGKLQTLVPICSTQSDTKCDEFKMFRNFKVNGSLSFGYTIQNQTATFNYATSSYEMIKCSKLEYKWAVSGPCVTSIPIAKHSLQETVAKHQGYKLLMFFMVIWSVLSVVGFCGVMAM
jgi:hypothetical protein